MNLRKSMFTAALLALAACSAPADGDAVGQTESEVRRCAEGATVPGIDVSDYQPNVDFDAVRSSGRRFAFLRVSDGVRYPDDAFARHWPAAKKAGLFRGAYQYFRASQDALAQANMVVDAVGRLGAGDLPAVLDIETADGASDATIVAKMRTWLKRVEEGTGKKPIVYTAMYFYSGLAGGSEFAGYPLWVANYGATCPETPSPWTRWAFWQTSDRGSVPGAPGNIDVNVWNGTLAELTAFANGEATDYAPIEVYWARQASGSYELRALPWKDVARVVYTVDGYTIADVPKGTETNFPASYTFTDEGTARQLEIRGFDASGKQIARGNGLIDVTADTAVYVRQLGAGLYEIGLERAEAAVAGLEVRADGALLTDGIEGTTRSKRLAVRSPFLTLGERNLTLTTYDANGQLRGTLRRTFVAR